MQAAGKQPKAILAVANQATLPNALKQRTLMDMKVGETAWTTPWAMWVDSNKKCWLNPDYDALAESGGTVQLEVTRQKDGFHVVNHDADYHWNLEDSPSYVGQGDKGWIPVTRFTQ